MRQILVLDNYDSFTYNLVHHLALAGFVDVVDVVRNDKIALDDVARYEKIILSPGPGIPSEAGIMPELITTFAPVKSILGICLGHQGIAEAFGGTLTNMETVVHGKESTVRVLAEGEPLFRGLPESFPAGRYHSWLVERESLPECFEITAETENGDIMGISHRKYDVKGLQFHPESVLTPCGVEILKNWMTP